MTPSLITAWMNTQGGARPAWLDDPLLRATYPPQDIEQHWGDPLKKMTAQEVAHARRDFEADAPQCDDASGGGHPDRQRH